MHIHMCEVEEERLFLFMMNKLKRFVCVALGDATLIGLLLNDGLVAQKR